MKDKKQSAAEIIYSACSYERLGHTTNYEFEKISDFIADKEFNNSQYLEFIKTHSINTISHTIHKRKSDRSFSGATLSDNEILQILFNAYSLKNVEGSMTIPQAGGLNIMRLHVFLKETNYWKGYLYNHLSYQLEELNKTAEDLSKFFYTKSVDFKNAGACILISSNLSKFSKIYLSRAFKFSSFQAGHLAQNILLTATALELKSVPLGSLIESVIINVCDLKNEYFPLYAVVLGK